MYTKGEQEMKKKLNPMPLLIYLQENKLSKKEFSIRSGVCLNQVNKLIKGDLTLTVPNLLKIAKYIKAEMIEFFMW